MRLLLLFIVITVFIGSCEKSEIEKGTESFQGFVKDFENTKPIKDATVKITEGLLPNSKEGNQEVKTTGEGYFEAMVTKKGAIDFTISHPHYFPYSGCLNYSVKCDKIEKDEPLTYSLKPAGVIGFDLIDTSGRERHITITGDNKWYLGMFTNDTIIYKKVIPGQEFKMGYQISEVKGGDQAVEIVKVPDTIPLNINKFDTITFEIKF